MRKITTITVLALFTLTSSITAIEQCDAWFSKNDFNIAGTMGKDGTGVLLNKQGELSKIFAAGSVRYDFNDGDEVSDALKEASMLAKSNIAKFMKEEITSSESVEKITAKRKELTKNTKREDVDVVRKTVKTQTLSIQNSAQALLTGVIKVCESNDAKSKEVQVVLALSPKTAAAASKVSDTINKEIGSRKSVEEYAVERQQNTNSRTATTDTAKDTAKDTGASTNSSFSNKTKNMNF